MEERHKTPLAAGVRELIEEARRGGAEGTIAPEQLLAYCAGELSEEERERLQDRLAVQPEAARVVLDLVRGLDQETREQDPRSTAETAVAWRAMKARLKAEGLRRPRSDRRRWLATLWPQPGFAYAVAGVLLVVSLGLSFWTVALRQRVGELSGPRLNVAVRTLLPADALTRDQAGAADLLELPPSTTEVVLILNLEDQQPYPNYRIELSDGDGNPVWTRRGLIRRPAGNFTVGLERALLPVGVCRIAVDGGDGESWQRLATYHLEIPNP